MLGNSRNTTTQDLPIWKILKNFGIGLRNVIALGMCDHHDFGVARQDDRVPRVEAVEFRWARDTVCSDTNETS